MIVDDRGRERLLEVLDRTLGHAEIRLDRRGHLRGTRDAGRLSRSDYRIARRPHRQGEDQARKQGERPHDEREEARKGEVKPSAHGWAPVLHTPPKGNVTGRKLEGHCVHCPPFVTDDLVTSDFSALGARSPV